MAENTGNGKAEKIEWLKNINEKFPKLEDEAVRQRLTFVDTQPGLLDYIQGNGPVEVQNMRLFLIYECIVFTGIGPKQKILEWLVAANPYLENCPPATFIRDCQSLNDRVAEQLIDASFNYFSFKKH